MMTAPVRRRSIRSGREDASAVVIALALAAVMTIAMGAAGGRVLSATAGTAGLLDREQARTIAEHELMLALAQLDVGGAGAIVRSGGAVDATSQRTLLSDSAVEKHVGTVIVSVTTDAEHGHDPRRLLRVDAAAQVGRAHHRASASVRPSLSVDHLLLSEFEVVDPALLGSPRADCASTRGTSGRSSVCIDTLIGPGVLDGPVHSNDAIALAPMTMFASELTTSHLAPAADGRIGPALWGAEVAHVPGGAPFGLAHRSELTMPREVAEVLVGVTVTCRLRGPTLLRFDGPRVRITSPRSVPRADESASAGGSPVDAIGCLGIDRTTLAGVAVVELPSSAVIEVVRDPLMDCVDHPLGLVSGEDGERDWWCNGGDAFVWGRYLGSRTVVAQDNVQIVWDLEPGDASSALVAGTVSTAGASDLLGLVAGDSIVLRRIVGRPVRRTAPFGRNLAFAGAYEPPFGAYPLDAPEEVAIVWDSPRIVASLAALRGSFTIQNPFLGEPHLGPLRLEGSLARRFRGVLAWEERNSSGTLVGTMGYSLELTYDRRLAKNSPPAMPLTDHGAIRILELDVG